MEAVRAARFKLVVDYGYGSTSFVMPNVLGKLGADVLGVNPYASTSGLISFDRDAARRRGRRRSSRPRVPTSERCIDPDGEHLTLVDDERPSCSPTARRCWRCVARVGPPAGRPDRPAGQRQPGAPRIWRPRTASTCSTRRLATAALWRRPAEKGVGFAASDDGGFILPGFLPAFDAAATLVKLLELLALQKTSLSAVRKRLPACTSPTRRS